MGTGLAISKNLKTRNYEAIAKQICQVGFWIVAMQAGIALALGVPGMLMVALLAYFSNLCGCLTNYSTGPVVIYSGFGYVPVGRWFKVGLMVSIFHLAVWLGVGLPYWKWLGWW